MNSVLGQGESLSNFRDFLGLLAVAGVELGLVAAVAAASYGLATWVIGRTVKFRREPAGDSIHAVRVRVRRLLMVVSLLLAIGIPGYNGWLVVRGIDVPSHTIALVGAISLDTWLNLGIVLGKLVAAALGLVVATRVLRRALRKVEAAVNNWDQLKDNDRSLATLFTGLNRAIVNYRLDVAGLVCPSAVRGRPSASSPAC
jgi:hypothetical protein